MFLDRRIARLIAAAAGVTALACSSDTVTDPSSPSAARTTLPRELTAAERTVLSSANAFSFALWRELNRAQAGANIFVSPLSASYALGMTLNGAAGPTFDEMRAALQVAGTPLGDIDASYKSLTQLLSTLDPKVTMQIANSIWYRNTFTFNKSFLDAGANWFDASINPLNFADTAASLAAINGWVNTKTNGKIPSILDQIHDDDVMFLINAIYFKGGWRLKFDPNLTQNAPFHGVNGDQTVSLMHKVHSQSYTETSTYQAVDLAYGDSSFTMTVILPKPGSSVEQIAASLDAPGWTALTGAFHPMLLDLSLPKFKLAWEAGLKPNLQSLGMRAAFAPGADFTRMSSAGGQLYISFVKQKAFVDVNEEGTEAAAVTVVGVTVTSAPQSVTMRVDRPFIFAIRERLSGTVLFMGKVVQLP